MRAVTFTTSLSVPTTVSEPLSMRTSRVVSPAASSSVVVVRSSWASWVTPRLAPHSSTTTAAMLAATFQPRGLRGLGAGRREAGVGGAGGGGAVGGRVEVVTALLRSRATAGRRARGGGPARRGQVELGEDVGDVLLDGAVADHEGGGDGRGSSGPRP